MVKKPCARCDEPAKLRCSNCRTVWYCSKDCSGKDWAEHFVVCQPKADSREARTLSPKLGFEHDEQHGRRVVALEDIAKGEPLLVEEPISVVSNLVRTDPKDPGNFVVADDVPRASELIARQPGVPTFVPHAAALKKMRKVNGATANAYLPHMEGIKRSDLAERMRLSVMPVFDVYVCREVCTAYYSLGSWFNHSCDPNAAHSVSINVHLLVEAKRDIAAGEEVAITYLPELVREQCVCRRTASLAASNLFAFDAECWCDRCVAERETHEVCTPNDEEVTEVLVPRSTDAFGLRSTSLGHFSPVLRAFFDDFNENGDAMTASLPTMRKIMVTMAQFAPEEAYASGMKCSDKNRAFAVVGLKRIRQALEKCPDDFIPRPELVDMLLYAFEAPDDPDVVKETVNSWADHIGKLFEVCGQAPYCSVLSHFSHNILGPYRSMIERIQKEMLKEKKDNADADDAAADGDADTGES